MYGVVGLCLKLAARHISLFLLLSVWYHCHLDGVSSLPSEKAALLAIKASIRSDPLGLFSDWREDVDHCSWRGLSCDASQRVVSVNITGRRSNSKLSPTCNFAFYKSIQKDLANPAIPCLAYEKASYRAGCPKDPEESASVMSCAFRGTLSKAVGNLEELRHLSLSFVGFSGKIPKELSSLKNLQHMNLEGNAFSGSLPSGLGHLSTLKTLNVAHNDLQGIIPQEISSCKNLEVLNLGGNRFSGTIPTFFEHLPNVSVVALSSNQLTGIIPSELTSNCGSLKHLHLEDNYLSGDVPTGLGNCSQLQSLVLSSNALSGTIPIEIGQLQKLQILDVSRNSLGGNIPNELGNCSRLSAFVLTNHLPLCEKPALFAGDATSSYQKGEYNHFFLIPEIIMALPNLQLLWAPGAAAFDGILSSSWSRSLEILNLASNSLTGHIPDELAGCNRLIYLDLSNNKLKGSLPSLPVQCMVVFNVSKNQLTGELPVKSSTDCPKATLLNSFPSHFLKPSLVDSATDAMPSYFSKLYCGIILSRLPGWFSDQKSLVVVHDMSMNNFTGALQSTMIGDVLLVGSPAYEFSVSGNRLNGVLSSSFFRSCQNLRAFSLKVSSNNFLGELPADAFLNCTAIKVIQAANNSLNGTIPLGIGGLKNLVEIDLSSNCLSGELPSGVMELQELCYLLLAENNLMGGIPETFGALSSLLVLDFSGNNLTGSVPKNLAKHGKFAKLLLSNNHLSGIVPENLTRIKDLSAVDMASDNISHTLRRSLLSTPPPSNQVELDAGHVMTTRSSSPNAVMIAGITAGCAVVAVLIIIFLLCYFSRQDNHAQVFHRQERRHLTMFCSLEFEVTYENVVAAAGNFSLNNLIGTGGFGATYKAELSPGFLVAVKKLSLDRFQGTQQFEAEIRALRRVHHPHLVTLFGYYASDNQKFLIYNYLPGGNLESLLHDPGRGRIGWRVRLRIASHVAQALAYLHYDCTPRVLHRDIKPSNVLLDNNLHAFLSDFGLARLLNASETHATTDVAGTFGYVAPEYAMTCHLSEKADVYSYGVVLLELLSGKKSLDSYFSKFGNGYNIVHWASSFYRQGNPLEILAPELWEQGMQSELTNAVKLAIRCTMTCVSMRPTMREVVSILSSMS